MNQTRFATSQETPPAQELESSRSQEEDLPLFEFYHQTIKQLDQTVSELQQEFSAFMQCKKGCSGCCIDGFRIRYIEAVQILNGFATMKPEEAKLILDQLFPETLQSEENKEVLNQKGVETPKDVNLQNHGKCPLLINGVCSVYHDRPALCRGFGLIIQMKEQLASCSLNFQETPSTVKLKALDLVPYYTVLEDLSQKLWQAMPLLKESGEAFSEMPLLSIREYLRLLLSQNITQNQQALLNR